MKKDLSNAIPVKTIPDQESNELWGNNHAILNADL